MNFFALKMIFVIFIDQRLRQWESREKRKAADYEYEREEEENRHVKQEKDKKRLAEFLEDYDDDKSDGRYYRVSEERDTETEKDSKHARHILL